MEIPNMYTNEEILSFKLPKYNEIPGVGLFLEQVAKYINECLNILGEPELTGSMISNYVKKGIIANPVKKTYSREQIAYLIFIAIAKNILSLEDINCLFNLQRDVTDTEKAYVFFAEEFENILSAVYAGKNISNINSRSDEISVTAEKVDYAANLTKNICITLAHKIYLDMTFKCIRTEEGREG